MSRNFYSYENILLQKVMDDVVGFWEKVTTRKKDLFDKIAFKIWQVPKKGSINRDENLMGRDLNGEILQKIGTSR